jgi:hypothetical protein
MPAFIAVFSSETTNFDDSAQAVKDLGMTGVMLVT